MRKEYARTHQVKNHVRRALFNYKELYNIIFTIHKDQQTDSFYWLGQKKSTELSIKRFTYMVFKNIKSTRLYEDVCIVVCGECQEWRDDFLKQ